MSMPLTVRLDGTLEAALERYCAHTGVSKSLVVQESLAAYLMDQPARATRRPADSSSAASPPTSANYQAFAAAGLVGSMALGQGADKPAVRARMAAHLAPGSARDTGAAEPSSPAGMTAKVRKSPRAQPGRA